MAKAHLRLVAPATVKRTVTPQRLPNRDLRGVPDGSRSRAAHGGGQGQPLRAAGRHHGPSGLPARPTGFRTGGPALWDQVEFRTATLHVRRVKQGTPSTHPILGDELRALRRLQREQEPKSPFVFTSERGAPFTTAGFARMIERAGTKRSWLQGPPSHAADTPAATRLQIRDTIPERFRPTLVTTTSSTPCATQSCRRRDLRIFGGCSFTRSRLAWGLVVIILFL